MWFAPLGTSSFEVNRGTVVVYKNNYKLANYLDSHEIKLYNWLIDPAGKKELSKSRPAVVSLLKNEIIKFLSEHHQ